MPLANTNASTFSTPFYNDLTNVIPVNFSQHKLLTQSASLQNNNELTNESTSKVTSDITSDITSISTSISEINPVYSTPLPISSTSQPIHSCKHRERHDAMPFNSLSDINKMSEYFLTNHQYRNNLLLIAGCNFGIRISDLLTLHVNDLVNNDFTIKQSFEILEQKTSHVKKKSSKVSEQSTQPTNKTYLKRKNRIVGINQSVCKALRLYIENTSNITLNDYLFQNESRNNTSENKPMTRKGVEYVIKGTTRKLGIVGRYDSHSFRKTFGRFFMIKHSDNPRAIYQLQEIFGHSSPNVTRAYIGIKDEEIKEAYMDLNIGMRND